MLKIYDYDNEISRNLKRSFNEALETYDKCEDLDERYEILSALRKVICSIYKDMDEKYRATAGCKWSYWLDGEDMKHTEELIKFNDEVDRRLVRWNYEYWNKKHREEIGN